MSQAGAAAGAEYPRVSRRSFLKGFAATAGGILVVADVLSTKTFFLPPRGGWRAQTFIHITFDGDHVSYYEDGTLVHRITSLDWCLGHREEAKAILRSLS